MANIQKKPCWEPCAASESNISQFMKSVNERHKLQLRTYEDLHAWSVAPESLQHFWQDAYHWLQLSPGGIKAQGRMLETTGTASLSMFPPPKFFPSDSLNIAEMILRDRVDDHIAIHFAREGVTGVEKVTWRDLRERIRRIRSAMVNSGVVAGDVVAAVISNSVDAMTISLAALSLGAVWSSSSCDLGTPGITDRYRQVNPKMMFADDGYVYAGKTANLQDRITTWSRELGQATQNLTDVVIVPFTDVSFDVSKVYRGCTLQSFLERDTGDDLKFKIVPFSHPAFILYSSGTTGSPKCIVHSTGGVALKIKTDMSLQNDVRRSDIVFQYTTTSWVMWVVNLLTLSCSASMLLYDGSPFHPRPTILLELAQDTRVTVFGTSPRYLSELKKRGIAPRESFDLTRLRIATSTGSVLSADMYDWFYSIGFPTRTQLISMSGGTDIAGCFVSGSPILPVYAGEIQCKALGMAVEILDALCAKPSSVETSGQAGELVCVRPFPSQPLAFVGQSGEERYRSSYFERFGPGIWCQGDFIKRIPDTGGLIMLGRSDGVLNPSGVRFGSAEIYAVTETFSELADSICVGQRRSIDDDERVLLFVKMRSGTDFQPELDRRIRDAIRNRYSPRYVPRFIFQLNDIPYTVNGKKCEINVKHIVNGRKTAVSGTVANPEALKLYEEYQHLPAEGTVAAPREAKL